MSQRKPILRVADLFCGAGGTSTGLAQMCEAMGIELRLTAVNHWQIAVETHTRNHPGAEHFCMSLDNLDPRKTCPEGLDLLWASPECTHHSIARGGKPINDQSRATAWCVVRWAEALGPKVIMVENVPEFMTWGGIGVDNRPMKSKKGATFMAWVGALESLGYRVDWQILCAADYGDPTTRKRLFVQAVRGKRKITWPDPTHAQKVGEDLFGRMKPWRAAREIIDWDLPAQSIYERKKPLSDKTMRRIMEGLKRYGLKPFIAAWDHQSGTGVWSGESPLSTVTTKARHGVAEPFLIPNFGEREGQKPRCQAVTEPLPTVTSHGAGGLVQPFLVEVAHGDGNGRGNAGRSKAVNEPLGTVPCSNRFGVAQPFLVELHGSTQSHLESSSRDVDGPLGTVCANGTHHGVAQPMLLPQQSGGALRAVDEPAPTVACAGAIGLVEPFLVPFYGTAKAQPVSDPLATVTCHDRFGLARPTVVVDGETYAVDIRFRMLQPHELSAAQGFPKGYQFAGTKTEQVRQIGNAVPVNLAGALGRTAIGQIFKQL